MQWPSILLLVYFNFMKVSLQRVTEASAIGFQSGCKSRIRHSNMAQIGPGLVLTVEVEPIYD